jgi:predicted phage baseplate assembly protein
VLVTYAVSEGAQGNVARNRHWVVDTIEGVFGVNPDPVSGGSDPLDWIGLRRAARGRAEDNRPLISSADIETAALALPLLEVARAWVLAPQTGLPNTGTVTLVAMRSRPGGVEPVQPPETRRWLEAIRRQLAGQMPLGTTLAVVAPRYVDFTVHLQLQAQRGVDPPQVADRVRDVLRARLAMVQFDPSVTPRQPGVPVSSQDVYAWIRDIDGLSDVTKVDLMVGQTATMLVPVPPDGLPRFDLANSQISVARAAPRSAA